MLPSTLQTREWLALAAIATCLILAGVLVQQDPPTSSFVLQSGIAYESVLPYGELSSSAQGGSASNVGECGRLCQLKKLNMQTRSAMDQKADAELQSLRQLHVRTSCSSPRLSPRCG